MAVPRVFSSWIRFLLLLGNVLAPMALFGSGFRVPWIIGVAAVVHGLLIYAIVAPQCAWLGPVVTRFRPQGREVWLTIDDGPSGQASSELAQELQRRGVRATFFLKGHVLSAQPQHAAQLRACGHTLANHTHTHPASTFWWLWPTTLRRELDACNAALGSVGVTACRWFRAPVGLKHVFLHRELAARGMRLIAWNVRGLDGVRCDPEAVVRRVLKRVVPGSIVVLHEGRARSMEGIVRVIEELQRRGYAFVIPGDEQLI